MEERKRRIAGSHLPQVRELLFLVRTDDRKLADFRFRLSNHALCHGNNTLRQTLPDTCRITCVIVLHYHTAGLNLDVNRELRHIQLQQFLCNGLSLNGIFGYDTHLVCISDGRCKTEIGSNAGKRIVLVAQCLIKRPAYLLQIVHHRCIVNLQRQSKGVDEHANRVRNLQISPAATDGT